MFKDSVDLSFKDGFCACVGFCAGCRGVCVGSVVLERKEGLCVCVVEEGVGGLWSLRELKLKNFILQGL